MRILKSIVGATLLIGLATAAAAQDGSVEIPEAYRTGRSPVPLARPSVPAPRSSSASVEHPAAIDGNFWAEIFPIFNGAGGNYSYIRLGAGASASTFLVMFVGSPSGTVYGQGSIQVPANASPQYALSDLLTAAGAGPLTGGDTTYSIYVSNPATDSFYQHVIFNGANQFFEDVTVCPSGASLQGGRDVTNVHSSVLSTFPTTIYLHNFLDIPATYSVNVLDSRTGTLLGTLPSLSASANATYAIPESFFETQLNIKPMATQQHLTLQFRATPAFAQVLGIDPNPVDVGAIFESVVLSAQFNAVLNLSNKCLTNR